MKLTADEQYTWIMSQQRDYPRWRKCSTGFLLYIHPEAWVEAASRNRDGMWTVGRKSERTERVFTDLQDALNYGELLNLR